MKYYIIFLDIDNAQPIKVRKSLFPMLSLISATVWLSVLIIHLKQHKGQADIKTFIVWFSVQSGFMVFATQIYKAHI